MTEPSKQARDLAEEARYGSPDAAAHLIDAALAEARRETRTGRHWRIIADQERAHAHSLQAEREELAATVERVTAERDSLRAAVAKVADYTHDEAQAYPPESPYRLMLEVQAQRIRVALGDADTGRLSCGCDPNEPVTDDHAMNHFPNTGRQG